MKKRTHSKGKKKTIRVVARSNLKSVYKRVRKKSELAKIRLLTEDLTGLLVSLKITTIL